MPKKKPRDLLSEYGWKVFTTLSVFVILGGVTYLYKGVATAQNEAQAAVRQVKLVEQQVGTISKNVVKIERSAEKMADSYNVMKELVIKHDEALKYLGKRVDRLEK